ncbi:MAG: xylan beta,4-xylosidase [Verrucomicrobiota bacterium]|jgi:xylan 1,4-beta-xylosidase
MLILPGFHPDPSLCRVGDDYFIANSTFEWFPGVRFHRSRDLVNWTPCGHALTRPSQLDLVGNEDSGGVWAPCLTHADGLFWLVFSNVRAWERTYKDVHNYLVTAPSIEGPWSDPIYLNGLGFDPSLFHDDDGRKWLVQMQWNHRATTVPGLFDGIVLQEYSVAQRRLIGPRKTIFTGTARGLTEGPHLYKRNGLYYLLTAEGGTSWEHAATLARSRSIDGPYEADPAGHLLCAQHTPAAPLQKTGHGCLAEGDNGNVWLAYLCSRPLSTSRHCPLGRETALTRARWTADGWLRRIVASTAPLPAPNHSHRDDFDWPLLGNHWQTLRIPATPDWLSLTARPGWLRLRGRESFSSRHHQSLVARRLQSHHARATTLVDFQPEHPQQMAGLAAYYDTTKHYALHLTWHPTLGRVLDLVTTRHVDPDRLNGTWPLNVPIPLPATGSVYLAVEWRDAILQFSYSLDDVAWHPVGPELSAAELSDEAGGALRFTGTMIALYAQDFTGAGSVADFDFLNYVELPIGGKF